MTRAMAEHADGFSESQVSASPDNDEELIVVAADGKGIPMRRPLEERLQEHQAATRPKAVVAALLLSPP